MHMKVSAEVKVLTQKYSRSTHRNAHGIVGTSAHAHTAGTVRVLELTFVGGPAWEQTMEALWESLLSGRQKTGERFCHDTHVAEILYID
jgi:hypothetical protein